MTSFLDRLNLRPFEKRLVVIFLIVVFVLVNALLIWPKFGAWGKLKTRNRNAKTKLAQYNAEISKRSTYEARLKDFAGEADTVPTSDQAIQLMRSVQTQAGQSGVLITSTSRSSTRTNGLFMEQFTTISVQAEEEQLVDFLYKLGSGGSGIRVRDIGLRPDANRYKLGGNITLVASYQREIPVRSRSSATASASPSPPASPPSKAKK